MQIRKNLSEHRRRLRFLQAGDEFARRDLTACKKAKPYLKEADFTALQSSICFLSDAWNSRFDGRTEKPVFHMKGKKDYHTSRNNKGSITVIDKNHMQIPKLGIVKVMGLRDDVQGKILSAVVCINFMLSR